ncbi:MAG: hypothetical protein LBJ14_02430 [Desulfarculales bacterium]|jgi:hypothetical protein|nr:hypothetical protein [Desulfarculales bacterium]
MLEHPLPQEVIEAFQLMFEHFPEGAQLTHKSKQIAALNPACKAIGRDVGMICAKHGPPEAHKGCLANKALKDRKTTWATSPKRIPDGQTPVAFWIPVDGYPDFYLHFGLGHRKNYAFPPEQVEASDLSLQEEYIMQEGPRLPDHVIAAFHLMWDNFPENATLVHKSRQVLAVNKAAEKTGICLPGTNCARIGSQPHQGCLADKALAAGEARYVHIPLPDGEAVVFWIPLAGRSEYFLHFSIGLSMNYKTGTPREYER